MIDELLKAMGFVGDVIDTPGRMLRTGLSGRNPLAAMLGYNVAAAPGRGQ